MQKKFNRFVVKMESWLGSVKASRRRPSERKGLGRLRFCGRQWVLLEGLDYRGANPSGPKGSPRRSAGRAASGEIAANLTK